MTKYSMKIVENSIERKNKGFTVFYQNNISQNKGF